jgi:hypothetical protein
MQIASRAGHLDRGCLLFPQKKHEEPSDDRAAKELMSSLFKEAVTGGDGVTVALKLACESV